MSRSKTYTGQCFCGDVVLQAAGEPTISGLCHCDDCRAWSACPVTAYCKWPFDAVKIVKGKDSLATYAKTDRTPRAWCRTCGGHIGEFRPNAEPPHIVIFPAVLSDLDFRPQVHVWCQYRVLTLEHDGLPKYQRSMQHGLE